MTTPAQPEPWPIWTAPRADGEIRVSLREFKGKRFLDARFFFTARPGELFPTRKGVTIRTEELPEFIRALCAAARELGLDDEPLPSCTRPA